MGCGTLAWDVVPTNRMGGCRGGEPLWAVGIPLCPQEHTGRPIRPPQKHRATPGASTARWARTQWGANTHSPHTCANAHAHPHVCASTRTPMCASTSIHACKPKDVCARMHTCTHIPARVCTLQGQEHPTARLWHPPAATGWGCRCGAGAGHLPPMGAQAPTREGRAAAKRLRQLPARLGREGRAPCSRAEETSAAS